MENTPLAPLPAWLDTDARKVARQPMHFSLIADSNLMGHVAVTIADISALGALIDTPSKLKVGSFVTLRISDEMQYSGWIAWAKNGRAGLDFAAPLDAPVVEQLVALQDMPVTVG